MNDPAREHGPMVDGTASAPEGPAPTYGEARARFRRAAERAGAVLTGHRHPARGPEGEHLAVDIAVVGPDDATSCLWLVSGTHGVEGYAGSALQCHWLDRRAVDRPDAVRVVLVHGLNPYGFAWVRRVDEQNVDLNRNALDWSLPPPVNEAYDELAPLLVPTRWDDETRAATDAAIFEVAARVGFAELQRIVSSGQYHHPDGVFYGGTGPVWSHRLLADTAPTLAGAARRLGIVDVHTGLGPWGHGELITHESAGAPGYERAGAWWGRVHSMVDGDSVSAPLTGDWLGRIEAFLPSIEVTAAALEFGTLDVVDVLQALRADAWLHAHGDPNGPAGEAVRAQVRAAFVDDDPSWFATIRTRFDEVVDAALVGLVR
jgi:hypothetical protein